jgi:hypothetical protein
MYNKFNRNSFKSFRDKTWEEMARNYFPIMATVCSFYALQRIKTGAAYYPKPVQLIHAQ